MIYAPCPKTSLSEKGWYGREDKTAKDKKYINWRLKTIYQTNVLTAYSAGETRQMLKTTHLYPYWQYQQVQRSSKRQKHEPFHDMVLHYDDPFWATGTPPNGWGCQCYRDPLTASQAKASGKVGLPQGINIDNHIDKEWRYDPGREMLAPNFSRYTNLRHIKPKGEKAITRIMKTYRQEMQGYQLTKGEWDVYVSNVPNDSLSDKRLYADVPILFSLLRSDVADEIGEDVKLILRDKDVAHGSRLRNDKKGNGLNVNLTLAEMKQLPEIGASPDEIFQDTETGNLIFSTCRNDTENIVAIFVPGHDQVSLSLTTFFIKNKDSLSNNPRYNLLWPK